MKVNHVPTHPGQVLLKEFLKPAGVPQLTFAKHLGVTVQRVNQLVKGKRGVSPSTAWLLAGALGTTPQFWMQLQMEHDLARERPARLVPKILGAP